MKKYVRGAKAEKSLFDNTIVSALTQSLMDATTKLSYLSGSVRDMFEGYPNQYHDEIYNAIAPVLQSEFGVGVEDFKQYLWDLEDSLAKVTHAIVEADRQFRNNEVK